MNFEAGAEEDRLLPSHNERIATESSGSKQILIRRAPAVASRSMPLVSTWRAIPFRRCLSIVRTGSTIPVAESGSIQNNPYDDMGEEFLFSVRHEVQGQSNMVAPVGCRYRRLRTVCRIKPKQLGKPVRLWAWKTPPPLQVGGLKQACGRVRNTGLLQQSRCRQVVRPSKKPFS